MSNRSMMVLMLLVGIASGAASGKVASEKAEAAGAIVSEPMLEQDAATSYRLASAQVVVSAQAAPVLKLAANGPIAFALLSADEAGVPASPTRIVARLYGITPGDAGTLTAVAPFVLTVRPVDNDSIVTVEMAGLPPGHTLALSASQRTSELEVRIVLAP